MSGNRIIGLDMHPDVFAAAALVGTNALHVVQEWVHDRQATAQLWKAAGQTLGIGGQLGAIETR